MTPDDLDVLFDAINRRARNVSAADLQPGDWFLNLGRPQYVTRITKNLLYTADKQRIPRDTWVVFDRIDSADAVTVIAMWDYWRLWYYLGIDTLRKAMTPAT